MINFAWSLSINNKKVMNYQRELDSLLQQTVKEAKTPTLLLHSCCAPCSSYVLEYLSQYFQITVFYYNPNIYPQEEFEKRMAEQEKLIKQLQTKNPVAFIKGEYEPSRFYHIAKGLENLKEGEIRCFVCYEMRLEEAAQMAKNGNFDYFATTLSVSPQKNAEKINEIGEKIGQKYEIKHLPSDFKKRGGYLRSIQLAKEQGLYRQNYCGCVFSMPSKD